MEVAYLHFIINHLPIMGVPLVLCLLVIGAWARSEPIKLAALLLFVALGMATVAVYLTGKGAADFAEHLAGVADGAIDAHEDAATIAFIGVEVLAALSLFVFLRAGGLSLVARRARVDGATMGTLATVSVMAAAIVASALLGYAGKLGGRIAHTEFSQPSGEEVEDGRERRGKRGGGSGRED